MKTRFVCLFRFCAMIALLPNFVSRCAADGAKPSVWVYPSVFGDLLYATDVSGLRVNDFSECGYRRGLVELPNVTNAVDSSRWLYLHPLGGGQDDGAGINAALRYVGSFAPNSNGFCGVVCLGPGSYTIRDTNAIRITNSGVILKGSGPSTQLTASSVPAFTLIQFEGSGDHVIDPSPQANMTEVLVPAGTRTFRVDVTNGFQAGDSVAVHHYTSASWLHAINMDLLGDGHHPWPPGGYDTDYERVISRIEGNWITLDTPIPQTFESQYGYGWVAHCSGPNRVQNSAVEDLLCYTPYGTEDESNPNSAVRILKAGDVWLRNVTASGYFSSAVSVGGRSKFVTIAQCTNYTNPSNYLHFRYSFYLEKSTEPQYVLMRDCFSYKSRHSFVLGSIVPGPNAFVRCVASESDDETGPHERWSTGSLFDNVREESGSGISFNTHEIEASNRGNSGGGSSYQGWTGGYNVMWNDYADDGFRVRNPPTARNWLIGSSGEKKESRRGCWYSTFDFLPFVGDGDCWAVGVDPDGTYDQSGEDAAPLQLHSLYYAQLQQRLKWPGSQFREYRLGTIGWYPGMDDNISVSRTWLAEVQSLASPARVVNNFDSLAPDQWTAFTFTFPVAPNERVVAASLSLGLVVPSGDHHLFLGGTGDPQSFTDLGWVHSDDGAVRYTVPILEPSTLGSGQLNVALDANCGVDFAMLNFQVAPVLATYGQSETAIDSYVRGGSYANQNFATNVELVVKNDNDASFSRRAFLYWNLIEFGGSVVDAKVRLYCNGSAQAGNEQSVAVVPGQGWSPNSVTWNTQPATDPPFAYFVPPSGGFVEFSVTPQVLAALTDPLHGLALCIDGAADWGSQGYVSYASSRDPDYTHHPLLLLSYFNSAPSLVVPGPQSMAANSTLGPLPVTVGDVETYAAGLVLTATSSVPSVIANSEITLGGSGSNRTVSIHVPSGRTGSSIITLTVSDGNQVTTTGSFPVTVNCVTLSPPVISPIADQTTYEDTPLTVFFRIGSACGPEVLHVRALSSNTNLFPAGSIELLPHDSSINRAISLTPAPDKYGTATITVAVANGSIVTNESFLMTVRPVEDPPKYVRITHPTAGETLPPGTAVVLSADAFDVETNLARIEFFAAPNQLLGIATNPPYTTTWSNPPAGSATLYAVAYDQTSLSATSAPVEVTFSVPTITPPKLFIGPATNLVGVVWLDSVSSNALQTTTSLVPPITWIPVGAVPQAGEGAWFYFFSPTGTSRFFRLAQ